MDSVMLMPLELRLHIADQVSVQARHIINKLSSRILSNKGTLFLLFPTTLLLITHYIHYKYNIKGRTNDRF